MRKGFVMHFVDMIMFYGRSTPEKQAIILGDRIVSYAMLASGIRSVSSYAREMGLKRGDKVAVRVESQIRHLIVVSALYRLGIVTLSVTGDIDLSDTGVKIDAVISDRNMSMAHFGKLILLQDEWFMRDVPDTIRPEGFADNDLARIIMSSGATAKAIGMSARVVEDRIMTGRRTLTLAPWDRMMCLPVLTSGLGFGSALQALAYGHALVFA